jgi:hypothetical protein
MSSPAICFGSNQLNEVDSSNIRLRKYGHPLVLNKPRDNFQARSTGSDGWWDGNEWKMRGNTLEVRRVTTIAHAERYTHGSAV